MTMWWCAIAALLTGAAASARFSVTDDSFGNADVVRLKVLHDGQTGALASVRAVAAWPAHNRVLKALSRAHQQCPQ
jgi:hypothetical protein